MTQTKVGGSLIGKIGSYLQIVAKDPRSTAFVPLAEAYRQVGLLSDALEAARLGTRMLPHFSPGFAALGRILGQMGRIDEAMSAYAKALSIDRQCQSALVGLARLHLIRDERDQARRILHQAAEFFPEDEVIRNMLTALDLPRPWADIKQSAEISEPVVPAAEQSIVADDAGTPIPTATLAEIYVKQGLFDKAIKVYEDILAQNPDNEKVRTRLSELAPESTPPDVTEVTSSHVDIEPVEHIDTQTAVDQPEHVEVETQAPKVKRSPLEVLERWLTAIREGKAHVQ